MDYHAAIKTTITGTSLVVQWLRLPLQGVWGSIPSQGTRSHIFLIGNEETQKELVNNFRLSVNLLYIKSLKANSLKLISPNNQSIKTC